MLYSDAHFAASKVQAQKLRDQASKGGLRFDVYLPPDLAEWMLSMIERGSFASPSEAAFVILGEHEKLEPHTDLREEFLRRRLLSALNDKGPGLTIGEVMERIEQSCARDEPAAVWSDEFPKSDSRAHYDPDC